MSQFNEQLDQHVLSIVRAELNVYQERILIQQCRIWLAEQSSDERINFLDALSADLFCPICGWSVPSRCTCTRDE